MINKVSDAAKNTETHKLIEKVLLDNEIPLAESHQNPDGNLILTCASKADRDELKQLVLTANQDIAMSSPVTFSRL